MQSAPAEEELHERRKRARANPRKGARILVIDDSPTILTAMKRFLESTECVFLGALDARTGLEMALTQKPELIFLDIVMPSINGFAALRALRKSPRTRDVPIIMMSGNEQAKAQFFGAHIGADDFMKKPFSRFEVFARIARLLDDEGIPRRPPLPGSAPQEMPFGEAAAERSLPAAPPRQPAVAEKAKYPAAAASPRIPAAASPRLPAAQAAAAGAPFQPTAVHAPPSRQAQPLQAAPALPVLAAAAPHSSREPATGDTRVARPSAAPPPLPAPPPVQPVVSPVSPELLTQIARLAQLAQSDPEALAALSALSAQLTAQLAAAAMRPATPPQQQAVSM
ncbi:MAG: response regulator [Azoarcus sp.]|nr:response regulator [Azoarcus sp.]